MEEAIFIRKEGEAGGELWVCGCCLRDVVVGGWEFSDGF